MLLLLLLMFYYLDRGQRGAPRVAAAPARDLGEGKSLPGLTLDIYSSLDFLSFPILFISEPLMDLFYPSLDFSNLSLIFIYLEPSLCARLAGASAREGLWRRPRAGRPGETSEDCPTLINMLFQVSLSVADGGGGPCATGSLQPIIWPAGKLPYPSCPV